MAYKSYFESPKNILKTDIDKILEEIDIVGFSIVEGVLTKEEVQKYSNALDDVWKKQVEEFGELRLRELNDWGSVRVIIFYDPVFAELICNPLAVDVVSRTVGETAILHLINGIISFPNDIHYQSNLHRDFAKNFTSDKMLMVNAYWLLDDFTEQTGATIFLPHTHKISYTPSDEYIKKHSVQINAKKGAVVFFDSRIYHRAGINHSNSIRRGVNVMYSKPFIKQQIDLPELLKEKFEKETLLGQTLGMWTVPPKSLKEYWVNPENRTYKPGQG